MRSINININRTIIFLMKRNLTRAKRLIWFKLKLYIILFRLELYVAVGTRVGCSTLRKGCRRHHTSRHDTSKHACCDLLGDRHNSVLLFYHSCPFLRANTAYHHW